MKVITPEAVISYPYIFTPQKDDKGREKYSAALVFLPGTDISALKQAAMSVLIDKFGEKEAANKISKKQVRMPFRDDAEAKGYPEGSIFINVRSEKQPGVVSIYPDPATGKPMPIVDPDAIYPGAFVRASLTAFYYDQEGNRGVSFGLNNLQKTRDGERLDGRSSAQDEFEADPNAKLADLGDLDADTTEMSKAAKLAAMLG